MVQVETIMTGITDTFRQLGSSRIKRFLTVIVVCTCGFFLGLAHVTQVPATSWLSARGLMSMTGSGLGHHANLTLPFPCYYAHGLGSATTLPTPVDTHLCRYFLPLSHPNCIPSTSGPRLNIKITFPDTGIPFIKDKTVFPGIGILIVKIKWSYDFLNFITVIPILVKQHLILRHPPDWY